MDSMKTQDATGARATSAAPSSAGSLLADAEGAARAIGHQRRLDNLDGTWRCWACGHETAFHASLHCPRCLGVARTYAARQRAARRPTCEELRWEGMAEAIAKDSRMDRDMAVGLLAKARKLPSATHERLQGLELALERRFDAQPRRGGSVAEYDEGGNWHWADQEEDRG